jgi:sulfur carrier protein ThiS
MKLITNVYQNFEINDVLKIDVWYGILREMDFATAKRNLLEHCRISKFPPTPADIIKAENQETSYYALLRQEEQQEQLALAAYNEEAVPMPDHIRKRLESLVQKRKVNQHER